MGVDRQRRVTFWNKAAETLTGFTAKEVIARPCHEVICGRDEEGCLVCDGNCRDLAMALQQELIHSRDQLVRTRSGQEVWVNISTILIPAQWQEVGLLVHFLRDISRKKELELLARRLLSSLTKLSLLPGTDLPPAPLATALPDLTGRELEVLRLLASGVSTRSIAEKLFISLSTTRNHIHNILRKLGAHTRLEAVTLSSKYRLI